MIQVLDHGYVKVIETYGSDERIIEAARMSVDKGFLGWGPNWKCDACGCKWRNNHDGAVSLFDANQKSCSTCELNPTPEVCTSIPGDEKLLRYLWENKHATPFEMAGAIIEVQAPIFVYREWHRHRTQSYNEMSSRYTPLPDVNYIPTVERLMRNAGGSNKQAGTVKGSGTLDAELAESFRESLKQSYQSAEALYQLALKEGVPKELARVHLPVGRYSKMRAHANLRNWLAFLTLRKHPAAQWEIQQYAIAVHSILTETFPRTMELFDEAP